MKPSVLMLGWEFPPRINGGLGVACKELGEALSHYLNVTMVIPRAEEMMTGGILEVIGINDVVETPPAASVSMPVLRYPAVATHLHHMEVAQVVANLQQYRPAAAILEAVPTVRDFRKPETRAIDHLQQPKKDVPYYGPGMIGEVIRFGKQSARLATAKGFDIIHAHDWMTCWAGLEIRAKSGKPLVLHIHSLEYDRAGAEHYRNDVFGLEKFALEQADLVIPVSHYTATILENIYGVDPAKIFPVHNGVAPLPAGFAGRKKHFPEKLVTFAGRITRQKGPARFLEMALQVLAQEDHVRFVMAGKGDLLPDMIEAVAMLGIGDRFHFTGFLSPEALNDLYALSDVFVLPSLSEPFGLSALEAARHGAPCVLSAASGVLEVMPSAPVVPSGDAQGMAREVLSLLGNEERRARLAVLGRAEAARATWDAAALRVIQAYERLG